MSFLLHRQGVTSARLPPSQTPPILFEDNFDWGEGELAQRQEWEDWFSSHDDRRLFVAASSGGYAYPERGHRRWCYMPCTVEPGPDQFAEAHFAAFPSSGRVEIRLRVDPQAGERDCYTFGVMMSGWEIRKRIDGFTTTLNSADFSLPSAPFALRAEAVGSTLRLFLNGAQLGTAVTDSALLTGLTGLMMTSGDASNTSVRASRFVCGSL